MDGAGGVDGAGGADGAVTLRVHDSGRLIMAVHDELRRFYEQHGSKLPPEAEQLTVTEVVKVI